MEHLTTWFAVFIGGGLGSMARFGTSLLIVNKFKSNLPLATLVANVLASLLLVWVVNKLEVNVLPNWCKPLVIIGFCGGFSTFSTFSYELLLLVKAGNWSWALLNVFISIFLCVGLMWAIYKSPA